MIRGGDRFETRLVDLFCEVSHVGDFMFTEGGQLTTARKAVGAVYAVLEIRVPNRKISGDVRCVRQTVRLANIGPFRIESGDGG